MNTSMTSPRTAAATLAACLALALAPEALLAVTPGATSPAEATAARSDELAARLASGSFRGAAYRTFVPSRYRQGTPTPLVVMLHGCAQDADGFATASKMNDVAEQETFIAVYPEQPYSANPSKCWNWYQPENQSRGGGEPALIAGIVSEVKAKYTIDDKAVFAAGFSAGAAMSVILGATYPDIFSAIGVGSGLEYKAATCLSNSSCFQIVAVRCSDGQVEAFAAMCKQGGPDPKLQAAEALAAMGQHKRVMPVIVFHGAADGTVIPKNADQVVSQWAQTSDLAADGLDNDTIDDQPESTTTGQVPSGRKFTRSVYHDSATGGVVMEKYAVDQMRHAWSGGSQLGMFTDPRGPDASRLMWQFFKAHRR